MEESSVQNFIDRWAEVTGTERANYQLFLTDLCELLDLPRPEPASVETEENAYVFERRVDFHHADGSESKGFIDLYRRGSFVLEAKQTGKKLDSKGWGNAMLVAHGQAQQYARALPAGEGRPPFLVVTDVGRNLELYSEFSRSGATYVPFPDPRSHRIRLEDLRDEETRETLRTVWLDPLSLDPSRRSARVTRDIAAKLAKLAASLEDSGEGADTVAAFLMRCLFTMFAEDVGLLPERSFTRLLEETRKEPEHFPRLVPGLWKAMNSGGFSAEIRGDVLRFNGGLFAEQRALPLNKTQINLLLEAAKADWRDVEPAIFGTLLERALDPRERHRLGAHYTPRAYVERLVLPTVIEPLREEWADVQAVALTLSAQRKKKQAEEARKTVRRFHRRLCNIRVLDPACGSGNFLYVTLEHLKRLEGEVFNFLTDIGDSQSFLEMDQASVDPHQMLGIETNPRAARIAEAVLWIGYLQWHFRTRGNANPPEPVLRDFHNIENRDALLVWDREELLRDESGQPITHWDGVTTKRHPVTGEQVPNEEARIPLMSYLNPRKAEWPEAEFVVGNPPFIGTARMRQALGDGYAEALRKTYPQVPESADYVMYWWHSAAEMARGGKIRQFGLITTNSIRQTFNRRVIQHHLEQKKPLSIVFAIPDHPWVDSSDGAAVRIAMTVGAGGALSGFLSTARSASKGGGQDQDVELMTRPGLINSDLTLGVDLTAVQRLGGNRGISQRGFELGGGGFLLKPEEAVDLGIGRVEALENYIRPYLHGRDLTQETRGLLVIDFFGLREEEVRRVFPEAYQWLFERVKPQREQNRDPKLRRNWWLHRRLRKDLRMMLQGLERFVVTVETSKHRFFSFLGAENFPDNMLVNFASDDASLLGVLSSRVHANWALAAGGRLGYGNDPRYNKTRCFETFPFPEPADRQRRRVRDLGEELNAHRTRQQAQNPKLTITGMYNVLEKLRTDENLSAKDKRVHEQGLVSVLAQLHDELDAAVLDAYGWSDLAPALVGKPGGTTPSQHKNSEQEKAEEELLRRLVALNAERAAEEARGLVRWLRPEFQNPGGATATQESLGGGAAAGASPTVAKGKRSWPKALAEQVQAVRSALVETRTPASVEELARQFKRAKTQRVGELLDTLAALGQARETDDGRFVAA